MVWALQPLNSAEKEAEKAGGSHRDFVSTGRFPQTKTTLACFSSAAEAETGRQWGLPTSPACPPRPHTHCGPTNSSFLPWLSPLFLLCPRGSCHLQPPQPPGLPFYDPYLRCSNLPSPRSPQGAVTHQPLTLAQASLRLPHSGTATVQELTPSSAACVPSQDAHTSDGEQRRAINAGSLRDSVCTQDRQRFAQKVATQWSKTKGQCFFTGGPWHFAWMTHRKET